MPPWEIIFNWVLASEGFNWVLASEGFNWVLASGGGLLFPH
jgi:hypothetical protein